MPVHFDLADRVATVTIDDPERRNPLTSENVEGLLDAFRRVTGDGGVSVVVLTGAGDRAFSAGGDLSGGFFDDPVGTHHLRGGFAEVLRAMWSCGRPVVGRINGHALAGGFGLAIATDITICVEDARLGAPEVGVGLFPMMLSVPLLRTLPPKQALELCLTGREIPTAEAERLGVITRAVPREMLDVAVSETVDLLLSRSPAAIALGRDAFNATVGTDWDTALTRLQAGLTAVASTDDAREGIEAFQAKRRPDFTGR